MAGAVGVLPTSRVYDVAAALGSILKAGKQQALGWLVSVLSMLPDGVVPGDDKKALLGRYRPQETQPGAGGGHIVHCDCCLQPPGW